MGKNGDFLVSSFRVVDTWRILRFNRKTQNIVKSLIYGFGGRCHKITDIWMDVPLPLLTPTTQAKDT